MENRLTSPLQGRPQGRVGDGAGHGVPRRQERAGHRPSAASSGRTVTASRLSKRRICPTTPSSPPAEGNWDRAQAVQAEACALSRRWEMNPILLKPEANHRSQVVLLGKPASTATASYFARAKPMLWDAVASSLDTLRSQYDVVVIEGAGKPGGNQPQAERDREHEGGPAFRRPGAAGRRHRPGRRVRLAGPAPWRSSSPMSAMPWGRSSSTSSGATFPAGTGPGLAGGTHGEAGPGRGALLPGHRDCGGGLGIAGAPRTDEVQDGLRSRHSR